MPKPEIVSEFHRSALLDIFSGIASKIERVEVFGSRSMQRQRRGSDLDLLLVGDIGLDDLLKMSVKLEESDIGINVDLLRASDIDDVALRNEIMGTALLLFTQRDLLDHRIQQAL